MLWWSSCAELFMPITLRVHLYFLMINYKKWNFQVKWYDMVLKVDTFITKLPSKKDASIYTSSSGKWGNPHMIILKSSQIDRQAMRSHSSRVPSFCCELALADLYRLFLLQESEKEPQRMSTTHVWGTTIPCWEVRCAEMVTQVSSPSALGTWKERAEPLRWGVKGRTQGKGRPYRVHQHQVSFLLMKRLREERRKRQRKNI